MKNVRESEVVKVTVAVAVAVAVTVAVTVGVALAVTVETFRSDYDYEIRMWEAGYRLLHVAVASASNEILD